MKPSYKCKTCGHVWDFYDLCPECGSNDLGDVDAKIDNREEHPRLQKNGL